MRKVYNLKKDTPYHDAGQAFVKLEGTECYVKFIGRHLPPEYRPFYDTYSSKVVENSPEWFELEKEPESVEEKAYAQNEADRKINYRDFQRLFRLVYGLISDEKKRGTFKWATFEIPKKMYTLKEMEDCFNNARATDLEIDKDDLAWAKKVYLFDSFYHYLANK